MKRAMIFKVQWTTLKKALETAIEREYKPIEAKACIGLGDTYRQKSEIPAAIEHYQKALENAKKTR